MRNATTPRIAACSFALLICIVVSSFTLALPPSTLDPSFGVGGIVLSSPDGTQLMSGGNIALQSDGKIVMVGNKRQADNGAYIGMVVARYNGDGTLDTSFDGDGWATVTFNAVYENAVDVAIQPDGKILIAGMRQALFRLFGSGSRVTGLFAEISMAMARAMSRSIVHRPVTGGINRRSQVRSWR